MNLNPFHYFLKRYHSPNLKATELKRMLNFWFPFLVNRIHIIFISNDFFEMTIKLKHSFWNCNPNKTIWGGSITSALDPFFPVMIKQIILQRGIRTDFFSKAVHVEFIKQVKTHIFFEFKITKEEISKVEKLLHANEKYEGWHTVEGVDSNGKKCVRGKVQVFLRKR